MSILFLLPDIQDVPTGGNIYNSKMIKSLLEYTEVAVSVCKNAEDIVDVLLQGKHDIIIVDSLLWEAAAQVVTEIQEAASSTWILLVHYLAVCNPEQHLADTQKLFNALQQFDAFITTSQFSKDCLVHSGVDPELVEVVYPGLEEDYRRTFSQSHLPGSVPRILTVSSLLPGKGLIEFTEVLEHLPADNWVWHIAGDDALDPEYAARFKSNVKKSGKLSRVRWLGAVAASQMPALYPTYDLFVSPSRFETLGMAVREAMASGLPVIAYDVGGMSENLSLGGGHLIPAFDTHHMRTCIDTCLTDRDYARKLGNVARGVSLNFPSWTASARRFAGFLKKQGLPPDM